MKNHTTRVCFAAGLAMALAACGSENIETAVSSEAVEDRRDETFAQVLFQDPSLSIAAEAFERTGLIGALDGEATYTIFIPTNAAFEALGEDTGKLLADPQNSAIAAAVLRNHMVPGVLDMEAINKAIGDAGGKAAVANFGGGVLTLTKEDGEIVVRDELGRKAAVPGGGSLVGNGTLIAINAVLVDPALLPNP